MNTLQYRLHATTVFAMPIWSSCLWKLSAKSVRLSDMQRYERTKALMQIFIHLLGPVPSIRNLGMEKIATRSSFILNFS